MTQTTHRPQTRAQRGLTILEMLVVVTILAATAAIGFTNFTGVIEDSKAKIARAEMQEIARAIAQFRQDTGYYPKQGPFALLADGGGVDPNDPDFPDQAASDQAAWFYSPANFWQLYDCPDITSTHAQAWLGCGDGKQQSWNPNRGRGWRGPYLNRSGEGLVDLFDDLDISGSGSPISGDSLSLVFGIADPFNERRSQNIPWHNQAGLENDISRDLGGPYFLFDLDKPTARIVSMGPNGVYGGIATDSSGSTVCAPGGDDATAYREADDIVLCLD